MIWITSDLHLQHDKPFIYEARGFSSIQEHDEAIIKNWNKLVEDYDVVYILGDLIMGESEQGIELLRQLNGSLRVILGNHCTAKRIELYETLPNVEILGYANILKYQKYRFYLSHYPTLCSNFNDGKTLKEKVINLCGHAHTKDCFTDIDKGVIFHVEMDTNNCKPWKLDDIICTLKSKEGEM